MLRLNLLVDYAVDDAERLEVEPPPIRVSRKLLVLLVEVGSKGRAPVPTERFCPVLRLSAVELRRNVGVSLTTG